MFSAVIPIYNHASFVAQAICSALRSPLVVEVLLLDDGSTDGSRRVAARMAAAYPGRVQDLTPPRGGNRGAHHRLNELVAQARSEWIAVLNSDDAFVSDRFETVVGDARFAHADFIFGNLLFMNQHGALIGAKRGPFDPGAPFPPCFDVHSMVMQNQFLDLLSHQNFLGTTGNMIFRKALHERVGGFAAYRYVHDWDFALRAMALGRPLYVQRFLTAYRMHSRNTILENPGKVDDEAADLFARFVADFPAVLTRPSFQIGLQFNVNHACPRTGVLTASA